MRAPVYRSIDNDSTLFGLAFPSEVLVVLTVFWVTVVLAPPSVALLCTLAAWGSLKLATAGKPPKHLQHRVAFWLRQNQHRGRFVAAARARRIPRFPYARYAHRDAPKPPVLLPSVAQPVHPAPAEKTKGKKMEKTNEKTNEQTVEKTDERAQKTHREISNG